MYILNQREIAKLRYDVKIFLAALYLTVVFTWHRVVIKLYR